MKSNKQYRKDAGNQYQMVCFQANCINGIRSVAVARLIICAMWLTYIAHIFSVFFFFSLNLDCYKSKSNV